MVHADTFISKTKKLYMDTRTQRNMAKLSEDISEVHSIMTRNIADVLGQGERLDSELPPCQQSHEEMHTGFIATLHVTHVVCLGRAGFSCIHHGCFGLGQAFCQ